MDDVFGVFSDLEALLWPSEPRPLGDPEEDPEEDLSEVSPQEITSQALRSINDLEPLTVLYLLQDLFEDDTGWWDWPLELVLDLFDDVYELQRQDVDLIGAIHTLLSNDLFWSDAHVFNLITQAADGRVVSKELLPQLRVEEMMKAVDLSRMIQKLRSESPSFTPEIASYVALFCLERGLWALPDPLEFAQDRALEILTERGWGDPPLLQVQQLFEERFSGPPTQEIEVQALTLIGLRELRYDWARRSVDQIRRFKVQKTKES
jgi:hypothetical protein